MVTHSLPIVESLSDAAKGELTINQLAKELKKSYGYTNTHVHSLATRGILNKREVGSAILCSLNYATEETLGLLALISIQKKQAYLQSLTASERSTFITILNSLPSVIHTTYLHKKTLTIVTDASIKKINNHTQILRVDEFTKLARSLDLRTVIVIQHFEAFWSAIAQHKTP